MNRVSAYMSVYPLRQTEVSPGIGAALDALEGTEVGYEVGTMGTTLWGGEEEVFRVLFEAFRRASSVGKTTMVVTISNATPWPGEEP